MTDETLRGETGERSVQVERMAAEPEARDLLTAEAKELGVGRNAAPDEAKDVEI